MPLYKRPRTQSVQSDNSADIAESILPTAQCPFRGLGHCAMSNAAQRKPSAAGRAKETHASTFLIFSPPQTNRRRQRAPPQVSLGGASQPRRKTSAKAGAVTGSLARLRRMETLLSGEVSPTTRKVWLQCLLLVGSNPPHSRQGPQWAFPDFGPRQVPERRLFRLHFGLREDQLRHRAWYHLG